MVKTFEEFQKLSKDSIDATVQSFGAVSKSVQNIMVEATDFSKKAFEQNTAAVEKLMAAKSVDKAMEAQTQFMTSAYETYVAQATRFGELYADLAKETYKPFESYLSKVAVK